MVDIVAGAGKLEAVGSEGLSGGNRMPDDGGSRGDVAGRGKVGAVVGEHCVHRVGHRLDEMAEEVTRNPPRCLFMQFYESELGRAVDGDEQVEPPFRRVDLSQIDVEVAVLFAVGVEDDRQIERFPHRVADEVRHVPGRHELVQRGRQKPALIDIPGAKHPGHEPSETPSAPPSRRLLEWAPSSS